MLAFSSQVKHKAVHYPVYHKLREITLKLKVFLAIKHQLENGKQWHTGKLVFTVLRTSYDKQCAPCRIKDTI